MPDINNDRRRSWNNCHNSIVMCRMSHINVVHLKSHKMLHLQQYNVLQCLCPSVLWHCWLGGRKGIWPVKTEWGMLAWLSVWGEVLIFIWPRWCHCHSLSLSPVNRDWLYLSGTGLDGQLQKKSREPSNGCSSRIVRVIHYVTKNTVFTSSENLQRN